MSGALQRLHVGARLSEAAIFNQVVYLAGQVPHKSAGRGIADQVLEVLELVDARLAECGSSRASILTAAIYLRHVHDFGEMNRVWDAWVIPGTAPPRATVQAPMMNPNIDVEVVVTAAVERRGET